ncbi:MAG: polyketide synthase dehydratase domain-containing protein [Vicinamibacterales bacterium]
MSASAPGRSEAVLSGGGGTPPARWTPARFYDEDVFHGPAYRAIRAVTMAGGSQVVAALTPRALPPGASLILDFPLLDCAGQLAALWRIERTDERVGAFPFAAGALRVAGGAFRPTGPMTCRGAGQESELGVLTSTFEFADADGRVLAVLEGFEQRVVRLPDDLWQRLFSKHPPTRPISEARRMLETPASIWARALAHVSLDAEGLAEWSAMAEGPARVDWLVARA